MKIHEKKLAMMSPGSWFLYIAFFQFDENFLTAKEKIIASISMFACLKYDQQKEVEGVGRAMLKSIGIYDKKWPRLDREWYPGKLKEGDREE